jgi:2-amino-4-hydroxy-6-hydroxymethyldihydropteridine diphosphokinase
MAQVFLSLGSNLGDRKENLSRSISFLEKRLMVIKKSSLYETKPWGGLIQPYYINQIIEVRSNLPPMTFLKFTKKIERKMGRFKKGGSTSRIIDIDIIFYDRKLIKRRELTVPHLSFHKRLFVLQPMAEINSRMKIPGTTTRIYKVLNMSSDTTSVEKLI